MYATARAPIFNVITFILLCDLQACTDPSMTSLIIQQNVSRPLYCFDAPPKIQTAMNYAYNYSIGLLIGLATESKPRAAALHTQHYFG
ncbi:hypothetical protein SISSUDRAFT_569677 [Sistotremastrum suecicum HHB10207 ss-3]|uniref:Uncharacterized protein n=1 Tax=Sistotremastrum suecicum HHB10207 ss-3 TaxID=1314776 RepID=A0A165XH28_9AGAM|nr:hypothetical protein SISSUDRAFT_569677 [Sistotremastrum suecicum HHB10207 ss-3]